MRTALLLGPLLAVLAQPLWADARMTILVDLLQLPETARILHQEDLAYAEELHGDMLGGDAGLAWQVQVEAILEPARVIETVRRALEAEIEGPLLEQTITFLRSDLGARTVTLENAARTEIADEAVETAARQRYAELAGSGSARLALLERLAAAGDMIDRNVTSAMNANFQFMRGMAEGGAYEMSEADMLADITGQADAITEDTEAWLYGYMLLAYHPLSDAELRAYAEFSETEAGRALNRGLFNGIEASYADISYGLGRVVALNLRAEEL
ncbi:hypothetical protein ACFSUD_06475 [Sulfitobacter aestuarii]|uniref:DUF2059 domain-containing protein n=1 Tax=Sulfitobacter aestuarii TaxID=2161676 RepID=A0ABW5U0A0_9RHOB